MRTLFENHIYLRMAKCSADEKRQASRKSRPIRGTVGASFASAGTGGDGRDSDGSIAYIGGQEASANGKGALASAIDRKPSAECLVDRA